MSFDIQNSNVFLSAGAKADRSSNTKQRKQTYTKRRHHNQHISFNKKTSAIQKYGVAEETVRNRTCHKERSRKKTCNKSKFKSRENNQRDPGFQEFVDSMKQGFECYNNYSKYEPNSKKNNVKECCNSKNDKQNKEEFTHEECKVKSPSSNSSDGTSDKEYKIATKEILKEFQKWIPPYAVLTKKPKREREAVEGYRQGKSKYSERKRASKLSRSFEMNLSLSESRLADIYMVTQMKKENKECVKRENEKINDVCEDGKTGNALVGKKIKKANDIDRICQQEKPNEKVIEVLSCQCVQDESICLNCNQAKQAFAVNTEGSEYSWTKRYKNLKKVLENSLAGLKLEDGKAHVNVDESEDGRVCSCPTRSSRLSQSSSCICCLPMMRADSKANRFKSKKKNCLKRARSDITSQIPLTDSNVTMERNKLPSERCNVNNFFIINCESQRVPEVLSALNKNMEKPNAADVEALLADKECDTHLPKPSKVEKTTQVSKQVTKRSEMVQAITQVTASDCKENRQRMVKLEKPTQVSLRDMILNRHTQTTPTKKIMYERSLEYWEDKLMEPFVCSVKNKDCKESSCKRKYKYNYKSGNWVKKPVDIAHTAKHLSNKSKKILAEIETAANDPIEKELAENRLEKLLKESRYDEVSDIVRKYNGILRGRKKSSS